MSYSNEVYENIQIGRDVVTVSATDIDSGMYKFLIFFFSSFFYCEIQHFNKNVLNKTTNSNNSNHIIQTMHVSEEKKFAYVL